MGARNLPAAAFPAVSALRAAFGSSARAVTARVCAPGHDERVLRGAEVVDRGAGRGGR